jgi:hypothetical protein
MYYIRIPALQRQSEIIRLCCFTMRTFSLMKKYQKIKKVRRLHRGKASLQRGLSFFLDVSLSCYYWVVFAGRKLALLIDLTISVLENSAVNVQKTKWITFFPASF